MAELQQTFASPSMDREKILVPGHLYMTREGPAMKWVRLHRDDFTHPFFADTAAQAGATVKTPSELTALNVVRQRAKALTQVTPAGLILHVSRCGSTLLANALRAINSYFVLSEPQPFTQLFTCLVQESLPLSARLDTAQSVITLLGSLMTIDQKLVIKLASYNLMAFAELRQLWPQVPYVVLVREPLEVMVSQLRAPTGWCRRKYNSSWAAQLSGISGEACRGMSDEEFCGRVLRQHLDAVLSISDDKARIIDYKDLNAESIAVIIASFGIPFETWMPIALKRVLAKHSLTPDAQEDFLDDRDLKRQLATAEMIAANREWSQAPYASLWQAARAR